MSESSISWLFADLNSYFASVEQELRPELRGLPVAIVPVEADTTCCIAVSYEARSHGVRTGMAVRQARRLCPQLNFVLSRPKTYVEFHHRIRAAIEQCVPIHATLSVDEFCCALQGSEREPQRALAIAHAIKQALRGVGSTLRCSIGFGPNRLIAKTAAGMRKPDGLTLIERRQLPHALHALELRDVPGIGARMERRLRHCGINTVEQVCALNRERMEALWGGVIGTRLWLELRGEDLPDFQTTNALTISRHHILPPAQRTREGARQIACKMLQDCIRRLRKKDLWARGLGIAIYYQDHDHIFEAHHSIPACRDAITLQQHFTPIFEASPSQRPSGLCIFLLDLTPHAEVAGLFTPQTETRREAAAQAMDRIQQRFGKNAVYLASIHGARKEAPPRISFGPPLPLEEF